jgi:hypothetical protein
VSYRNHDADAKFREYIENAVERTIDVSRLRGTYKVEVLVVDTHEEVSPFFRFMAVYDGKGRDQTIAMGETVPTVWSMEIRHTLGGTGNYLSRMGWFRTGDRVRIILSLI